MEILRSCQIIYNDFTVRKINECDGITSIFTTPNLNSDDILVIIISTLITIYFILKIVVLFKRKD